MGCSVFPEGWFGDKIRCKIGEIQLMFGHSISIESWKTLVLDGDEKGDFPNSIASFDWNPLFGCSVVVDVVLK